MAEFKPFEMIMRIEYGGAVDDGDVMQVSCKAKPVSELVRCRDCKWFAEFTHNGEPTGHGSCTNPQNDLGRCPQADWFCGDGERTHG